MAMPQETAKPLKILLVEPNGDVQEAFAAMLRCVGHAVDVAAHGGEALAIAGRNPPDVVLSELPLTDMSGLDLCIHLRGQPRTAKCAMLALTAYCNNAHKEELLKVGFDHVLLKPVSLKRIMEVLEPLPVVH